ncbi:MAG: LON peptidase substrate-binding domain-containing protein [Acidimicrobiales bacterium]|nr:LON peptidase substrate-binding domain-containing protein [Acidimicrobiales bacterium]
MRTLPMFPLSTVVFPGSEFRLQVFEERYLDMIDDCIQSKTGFGVCLIEKGHEVGGGDQRCNIGTLASISQLEDSGSGQFELNCLGETRIRVIEWLPEIPYPNALIEDEEADDFESLSKEKVDTLSEILASTHTKFAELSRAVFSPLPAITDATIRSLYHLAEISFLGPYDRYRILAAGTLKERLRLLKELLEESDEIFTNELNLRGSSNQ